MNKDTKIHLIGYAHLDPVWLWRWQEGYAEIKATFRSALDRMNEFPDYIFTTASAAYYQWVADNAPEMFSEIVERVKEGRWSIVGGMWVQPDCNIPSGESFARHFLLSQRFFMEKFGSAAITGYNVDTFGHTASMPKMLAAAGLKNYVFCRPDTTENPDAPEHAFWWESDDGSRILAYRVPNGYASFIHQPGSFKKEYEQIKAEQVLKAAETTTLPIMYFFGVGNHGGGPSIKSLNTLTKLQNQPGGERYVYSTTDVFFDEVRNEDLPKWHDELQHHASLCYSACSEIKRNNRRAENRLTSAEKLSVLAKSLVGCDPGQVRMDKAWQNTLFNQFHDVLPGCSIKEAYDDAREAHGEALNIAAEVQNAAVQRLSWAVDTSKSGSTSADKSADWILWGDEDLGTPFVVFNSLSWERSIPVRVNRSVCRITDENGVEIPFQKVRCPRLDVTTGKYDWMFMADVPALGWRLYWAYLGESDETSASTSNVIENENLRLEVDPDTGHMTGLYDKTAEHEVFSAAAAIPLVIDIEHADTWGHGVFAFRDEVGKFAKAKVRVLEKGPVRSVLQVESKYGSSTLKQNFILYSGAKQVEVSVRLDWHEKHKLLKLSFPVNTHSSITATYDTPFGHVERIPNGLEECGQMWVDVGDEKYGVALLNDSKYSFDVLDNDLRMTVANSSIYADHFGQDIRDEHCEYHDQGIQYFKYALLPHLGDWRESDVHKAAISLNTEDVYIAETYHSGPLPPIYQGIDVTASNIIITAVKPAADGNGVIVRGFESIGVDTECEIKLHFMDTSFKAFFHGYGIKTFRVDNGGEISECSLVEFPI